LKNQILIKFV